MKLSEITEEYKYYNKQKALSRKVIQKFYEEYEELFYMDLEDYDKILYKHRWTLYGPYRLVFDAPIDNTYINGIQTPIISDIKKYYIDYFLIEIIFFRIRKKTSFISYFKTYFFFII